MQLTEQQKQQFQDDGYTVVPGLIPQELLTPIWDRMLDFLAGDHDWPIGHFQILDPEKYKNDKGGFIPVGVQRPALQEQLFAAVAEHPDLQAAMSQLLGGPVTMYTDQALCRNAMIRGGESFYHQDSYYWRLRPEVGCNVWIPLNPVGKDAGALAIMPGTQKGWTLTDHEQYYDSPSYHSAHNGVAFQRHRIPLDKVDFSKEVLLEMQPGDAAFFTNFTWHRAEKNLTGEHEMAYAIAYQLEEAVSP